MATPKHKPTIRDIASAAGVSVATVSKFVNGVQRFSADVEARIGAAITQFGYQSNPLARSMITGKTMAVGVIILDIRNPHFTGIVKGINRTALATGYSVMFVDSEESVTPERQMLQRIAQRVDGLIVSSRIPEEAIAWLADLGKPVVFFGRQNGPNVHSVTCDGHRAAYMLGRHLMELGHRRVAFVGFPASRWNADRLRGLTEALAESQLEPRTFAVPSPSAEAGEGIASSVLLGTERFDAVVCYNDLVAMGLMNAAQSFGLRIPEHLSVAGFDNILFGRYVSPQLTTIDMRSEHQGELAMTRLHQMMEGDLAPFGEVLAPQLIPRASTRQRTT